MGKFRKLTDGSSKMITFSSKMSPSEEDWEGGLGGGLEGLEILRKIGWRKLTHVSTKKCTIWTIFGSGGPEPLFGGLRKVILSNFERFYSRVLNFAKKIAILLESGEHGIKNVL